MLLAIHDADIFEFHHRQRFGSPRPPKLLPNRLQRLRARGRGYDRFKDYITPELEGYVFCVEQPPFFTEGRVAQLDIRGYGGGLPQSLGNLNSDCIVDDADLLIVLFNFGTNDASSDVNGDGVVDDADLLVVLFNFGAEG
ncbi:MAG: hypothetical protein NZ556_07885 [Fimbriimonadales bacterium]|nr:hypothetical protein [Fimbriimonadales bacterium]